MIISKDLEQALNYVGNESLETKLSPSYEEYYQNLLKANEVFKERYPNFK